MTDAKSTLFPNPYCIPEGGNTCPQYMMENGDTFEYPPDNDATCVYLWEDKDSEDGSKNGCVCFLNGYYVGSFYSRIYDEVETFAKAWLKREI